uniref:Uncharacterized protein n=1 Tax=Glossina austeni TaxID=7395 RepID=A0A1A9VDM7_GLOAU
MYVNIGPSFPQAPSFCIMECDDSGPTAYAKRHITRGSISSAFNLIIHEGIIWTFVVILFARRAYEANNPKFSYLWSAKRGPASHAQTMSSNKFMEVLRFVRFDQNNERSES